MNMFARFDENPAMTLQVIKKTKTPPQTKFAGGINICQGLSLGLVVNICCSIKFISNTLRAPQKKKKQWTLISKLLLPLTLCML